MIQPSSEARAPLRPSIHLLRNQKTPRKTINNARNLKKTVTTVGAATRQASASLDLTPAVLATSIRSVQISPLSALTRNAEAITDSHSARPLARSTAASAVPTSRPAAPTRTAWVVLTKCATLRSGISAVVRSTETTVPRVAVCPMARGFPAFSRCRHSPRSGTSPARFPASWKRPPPTK